MRPKLVEHMFQTSKLPPPPPKLQPPPPPPKISQQTIVYETVDYKPFIIHIFGILFMIFIGCFLYYRKITKEDNQQEHIQKIKQLQETLKMQETSKLK